MITTLPRLDEPPADVPDVAGADHPIRKVTSQVAFDPDGWTPERAAKVAELFDEVAPVWDTTHEDPRRYDSLRDALERGLPAAHGVRCIELGSGTGLGTRHHAGRFEAVVALDLSFEMLRRAPSSDGCRVQGDASRCPFVGGSADALVLINALLFPAEVIRLLRPGGSVVWVNTLGDRTPIHLPADDVVDALARVAGEPWPAVASEAGPGTWCVVHRPDEA